MQSKSLILHIKNVLNIKECITTVGVSTFHDFVKKEIYPVNWTLPGGLRL